MSATLIAPEGMEKAEFYIENTLVYTLEGDGSASYDFEIDLSNAPVLGNTNIVAKAYGYEVFEISVPVNLVRLKAEANVFTENFNTFTSGTWPSTVRGYIESANGSYVNQMGSYVHSEGDTALKVTLPAVYNKSSTYMEKDNIGLSKNCIAKIKFDAYFSSEKEYMRVELRDTNGGYPQYGGAGMGSIPVFASDGLKKIRFTCSSAGGNNEYILIDNLEISKQEFEERWFYTAEYEDAEGNPISFKSVKAEGAKINLKFSEDMGTNLNGKMHVENEMGDSVNFTGSYNAENKTCTAEISDKLLNGGKLFCFSSKYVILSGSGTNRNR